MPRYDELEAFIGRRIRAIDLAGTRIEGALNSVAHLDAGDLLLIGEKAYQLAKLPEIYLLEDNTVTRVWPPVAPGEDVGPPPEPERLSYDPALYDRAVSLLSRMVALRVAGQDLVGTLEAISSRTDANGPQVHLGVAEGAPTTVVQLSSVSAIVPIEEVELPPLGPSELEAQVLPTSETGYPFDGRSTLSKPLAMIAGQVLLAAEEFSMSVHDVLDHACRHYGLDNVGRQSLQAMLARLQELQPEVTAEVADEAPDFEVTRAGTGEPPTEDKPELYVVDDRREPEPQTEGAGILDESEEDPAAVAAVMNGVVKPMTTAVGPLLAEDTKVTPPVPPEEVPAPAEATIDSGGAFGGFGTSGPEGEVLTADKTRPPEDPPKVEEEKPKRKTRRKKKDK